MALVSGSDGDSAVVFRQEEGSSSESRTFYYSLENGEENEITIDVNAVERTAQEAQELLEEAAGQWEEIFLGDNASLQEVKEDLYLPESLYDGLVEVSYQSSDPEMLDTDGTVCTENIPQDGAVVTLTAEFSYGEYAIIKTKALALAWPDEGSEKWLYLKIKEAAEEAEAQDRLSSTFSLPETVEGIRITWKSDADRRWMVFAVTGLAAFACMMFKDREKEKRAAADRERQLLAEYPQMVEQLSVLLGSGMSVRKAWERIIAASKRSGNKTGTSKRNIYIEEMEITLREIEGGRPERAAYERFGSRIGLMPYRKLSSLLSRNISKGTRDIRDLMRAESAQALEMRKNRAVKLGEEAGTKLLFPMMIIFVLLIAVLMMPAMMSL